MLTGRKNGAWMRSLVFHGMKFNFASPARLANRHFHLQTLKDLRPFKIIVIILLSHPSRSSAHIRLVSHTVQSYIGFHHLVKFCAPLKSKLATNLINMAEEDMESDLWPLLEDLQDTIDGLSDSLKPLLKNTLPENTSRLPLVDQAKLYVLTTYAIESLLFCK